MEMITTTLTAAGFSQLNYAVAKHGHNASFYLRKGVEYALEPGSKMLWEDITMYSKDIAADGRNISVRIPEDQHELLKQLCIKYEVKMAQLLRHTTGKVIEDRYPNESVMIGDMEFKWPNPYLNDEDNAAARERKRQENLAELEYVRSMPFRSVVSYACDEYREQTRQDIDSTEVYVALWGEFLVDADTLNNFKGFAHYGEDELLKFFREFVCAHFSTWFK